MARRNRWRWPLLAVALSWQSSLAFPAFARSLALTHVTIVDSVAAPIKDGTIVMQGGRIIAVGPAEKISIPTDATVIEKRGKFVVPGLMDANVHLTGNVDAESLIRHETRYDAIAIEAAQVALRSGVTTVFDTEGNFTALQKARDLIDSGAAVGSRIFFAGHIIGFGGPISSDVDARLAELVSKDFTVRVNARWVQGMGPEMSWLGPDEIRARVAKYASGPQDFIKYGASGHKQEQMITFSERVQRVIVEEGHKAGKTVQVHAVSPESFDMALDAGVNIVTHCDITGPDTIIPTETLAKMKRLGTYCSILPVTRKLVESLIGWRGKDDAFVKHNLISQQNDRNLITAGIPLMLSTDGWLDDPAYLEDGYPRVDSRIILGKGIFNGLVALEELGMPAPDILRTATINIARGYKLDDRLGSIAVGKFADVVVLDHNPMLSAYNYRSIDTVIKEGMVVDRTALPTHPVITNPRRGRN